MSAVPRTPRTKNETPEVYAPEVRDFWAVIGFRQAPSPYGYRQLKTDFSIYYAIEFDHIKIFTLNN